LAGIGNGGSKLVKAEVRNVAGSSSQDMGGDLTYHEINLEGRRTVNVGDPVFVE